MNAITPNLPMVIEQPALSPTLRAALDTAMDLAANDRAPATRAAYASDFRIFSRWCAGQGLAPLPASPAAVAGLAAAESS